MAQGQYEERFSEAKFKEIIRRVFALAEAVTPEQHTYWEYALTTMPNATLDWVAARANFIPDENMMLAVTSEAEYRDRENYLHPFARTPPSEPTEAEWEQIVC